MKIIQKYKLAVVVAFGMFLSGGVSLCAFSQTTAGFKGVISENGINVRADSTVSSAVVTKVNKGQCVEVVKEQYDWYKIRLPKQSLAYVKKNFTEIVSDIPTQPNPETAPRSVVLSEVGVTQKTIKVKVLGDVVNVRAGAGESFPIIGKVFKDQELVVLDEIDGWSRIEPPQDSFGWIYKRFVTKDAAGCSQSATALDLKTSVKEGKIVVPVVASVGDEKTTQVISGALPVKAPEQPVSQEITARGVVKRFGNIFFKRDKFKIVTPEKKTFLLEYSKSSLAGFLYQTVSVTGTLREVSKPGIQTIEVSKIEVVD